VHRLLGHNISCDLRMEHLNKLVKGSIEGLGANKSEKAIKSVAKAMGALTKATESFDAERMDGRTIFITFSTWNTTLYN